MSASNGTVTTTCCIVGGGPAGMMLAVLLARAGVDVTILEKYPDFFRDFRGDTIHPSTLELLYELGWLDEWLKLPHNTVEQVGVNVAGELLEVADFRRLPTHCKFLAFMPQWDFLDFLVTRGRQYPTFHVVMETQATELVESGGTVTGVKAKTNSGEIEIEASLVVGADGRHSTIRELAGFAVENIGAPMDVLWMRISKEDGDPPQALGTVHDGRFLILIDRDTYWQCAYIIAKGTFDDIKAAGVVHFQDQIAQTVPALRDRVAQIDDWSKVSLLDVRVDRLNRWYKDGLLCIGDAAHAMSPIGGVGINLAIQDAVAAANLLAEPLKAGTVTEETLARVQERRMFPTKITQAFQVFVQNRAVDPILEGADPKRPPLAARLLDEFPGLRSLPARLLGLGVRPEHVHTPDAFAHEAMRDN